MPGGLVAGLVEDLGIALGAQLFLDAHMVVDEEVTGHIQHRQGVGGPDTGFAVDFDGQFGGVFGHVVLAPEFDWARLRAELTPSPSGRGLG
ncbi:hypothetical protein D3C72_2305660 [compost metagenome]